MQIKVCSFVPGQNLQPFVELIQGARIPYNLAEDSKGTHLFVDDSDLDQVTLLLNTVARPTASSAPGHTLWLTIQQWPFTFMFVALGLIGYVVASFDPQQTVVRWLSFTELQRTVGYFVHQTFAETYLQKHQWWRLITPTFLHFGIAHILFNGLALWEVGRRLEYCLKPRWYLSLFLIIGVMANVVQYAYLGPNLFGGLSGVLYGFFGAMPVLFYRSKHPLLAMPKGLYIFLGITLMLGPLGVMEKVFGVTVADGAHFGGLLCGLVLAAVLPLTAMKK